MKRGLPLASLFVLGLFSLAGCGSGLPSVAQPLTPTPDADFRQESPSRDGFFRVTFPEIQVSQLACGLKLATVRRPGSGTVAVRLANRYGGEPWFTARPGLSSLMNNTLLEGSRPPNGRVGRHPGIPEDKVEVEVGEAASFLTIQSLPDGVAPAVQALAWTALYPAFTEVALQSETTQSRFAHAYHFGPGMENEIYDLYAQVVGGGHRLARMPLEPKTYSREDVRLEYLRRYAPEDAVLIVVGDIESHERVLEYASEHFGPWKNPHRIATRKEARRARFIKEMSAAWKRKRTTRFKQRGDVTEAFSYVLLPGVHPEHPDAAAYRLLIAELGSLRPGGLAYELREQRQYNYMMYAASYAHPAGAETLVVAPVKPSRAVEATQEILAAIDRLGEQGLSAKRIADLRAEVVAGYPARLLTNTGVMNEIASSYADYGPEHLNWALRREIRSLQQVRPRDTQRVAQEVLRTAAAAVLISGPAEAGYGIGRLN